MAFAATGTFPGLVVENSYVASQHYDELLAKARAQDARRLATTSSPPTGGDPALRALRAAARSRFAA